MDSLRPLLTLLLLLFVGAAAYGYVHNPEGYVRVCHDVVVIFTETSVPKESAPQTAPSTAAIK